MTTKVQCELCNSDDAQPFYYPEGGCDSLCPACARNAALIEASGHDLHAQLAPIIQAWVQRWAAVGVSQRDLGYMLYAEGAYWHSLGCAGRPGHPEDNAYAFIGELQAVTA